MINILQNTNDSMLSQRIIIGSICILGIGIYSLYSYLRYQNQPILPNDNTQDVDANNKYDPDNIDPLLKTSGLTNETDTVTPNTPTGINTPLAGSSNQIINEPSSSQSFAHITEQIDMIDEGVQTDIPLPIGVNEEVQVDDLALADVAIQVDGPALANAAIQAEAPALADAEIQVDDIPGVDVEVQVVDLGAIEQEQTMLDFLTETTSELISIGRGIEYQREQLNDMLLNRNPEVQSLVETAYFEANAQSETETTVTTPTINASEIVESSSNEYPSLTPIFDAIIRNSKQIMDNFSSDSQEFIEGLLDTCDDLNSLNNEINEIVNDVNDLNDSLINIQNGLFSSDNVYNDFLQDTINQDAGLFNDDILDIMSSIIDLF